MLVDALVELGRYGEATKAAQRMVDLRPGVPSFTRVSYLFELRGDLRGARYAMQEALKVAYSPDDKAFALFQLGELAFNAGDFETAAQHYASGMELAPSFVPLLYGQAKAAAALGDTGQAVSRLPDRGRPAASAWLPEGVRRPADVARPRRRGRAAT
ncbi:MAG: hypothetical protein WKF73_20860 [Nocardioidaceae bacterium]